MQIRRNFHGKPIAPDSALGAWNRRLADRTTAFPIARGAARGRWLVAVALLACLGTLLSGTLPRPVPVARAEHTAITIRLVPDRNLKLGDSVTVTLNDPSQGQAPESTFQLSVTSLVLQGTKAGSVDLAGSMGSYRGTFVLGRDVSFFPGDTLTVTSADVGSSAKTAAHDGAIEVSPTRGLKLGDAVTVTVNDPDLSRYSGLGQASVRVTTSSQWYPGPRDPLTLTETSERSGRFVGRFVYGQDLVHFPHGTFTFTYRDDVAADGTNYVDRTATLTTLSYDGTIEARPASDPAKSGDAVFVTVRDSDLSRLTGLGQADVRVTTSSPWYPGPREPLTLTETLQGTGVFTGRLTLGQEMTVPEPGAGTLTVTFTYRDDIAADGTNYVDRTAAIVVGGPTATPTPSPSATRTDPLTPTVTTVAGTPSATPTPSPSPATDSSPSPSPTPTGLGTPTVPVGSPPGSFPPCDGTVTERCISAFTVGDAAPPANISLSVFQSAITQPLQMQVQNTSNSADPTELSPALTSTSKVTLRLKVDSAFTPIQLTAAGLIETWRWDAAAREILIVAYPRSSSWSKSPGCAPEPSPCAERADTDYAALLLLAADPMDLSAVPADHRSDLEAFRSKSRGGSVATNGQYFSSPTYNPATKGIEFEVGSPHFTSDGATVNIGFFRAFIPDPVIADLWGIADPAGLSAANTTTTIEGQGFVAPTVTRVMTGTNSPAGVLFEHGGFHFSTPKITIAPAAPTVTPTATALATVSATPATSVTPTTSVTPGAATYRAFVPALMRGTSGGW